MLLPDLIFQTIYLILERLFPFFIYIRMRNIPSANHRLRIDCCIHVGVLLLNFFSCKIIVQLSQTKIFCRFFLYALFIPSFQYPIESKVEV